MKVDMVDSVEVCHLRVASEDPLEVVYEIGPNPAPEAVNFISIHFGVPYPEIEGFILTDGENFESISLNSDDLQDSVPPRITIDFDHIVPSKEKVREIVKDHLDKI